MPTTITAWNGKTLALRTKVKQLGCGVRIVGHKVIRNVAYLTVQTFEAGRISGSGRGLRTVYRRLRSAEPAVGLLVPLGRHPRFRHHRLRITLRVGFLPATRGAPTSAAFVTVTFHHR